MRKKDEDPWKELRAQKPALAYLQIYPVMRNEARKHGYALGVHGSLGRDLDLIAVPWTEKAAPVDQLVTAIAKAAGLYTRVTTRGRLDFGKKPHGRRAFTLIPIPGDRMWIDLSVIPPRRQP